MNVEQVGMTWLTYVISCLSDQQAIMTWQERELTGTPASPPRTRRMDLHGRAAVTFCPGGNVNVVRHVMRIHSKGTVSHITIYHISEPSFRKFT